MKPMQEKRFEYKGVPCVIFFQSMGFRTGYIGLPGEVNVYEDSFDCHCGITYIENHLYYQDDKNITWVGFDCGHDCDGYDIESMKKYFGHDPGFMEMFGLMENYYKTVNELYEFRTLEYCEIECKRMVDQYLEMEDAL